MAPSKPAALFDAIIRYVPFIGICLFLAAFFLPACNTTHTMSGAFPGWLCAWMAFDLVYMMLPGIKDPGTRSSLVGVIFCFMSGCINLMVPAYLWFSFKKRSRKVCRWLAVALLLSIAATWADFFLLELVPLIGHFVWIAGILLILTRELRKLPAEDCHAAAS